MPNLIEYFNKQPRIGCLATSNKEGKVNVACFGSPRMVNENTIVMGLGDNRTLAYLKENPYGVFIVIEPGKAMSDWKGLRLYVKMTACHTSGEEYDRFISQMIKAAGDKAAKMIKAMASFEVYEIRPILDFGQGWEKAIS